MKMKRILFSFAMLLAAIIVLVGCSAESTTTSITVSDETFTVTWINSDGTVLETDYNVKKGSMPSYDGETPTKEADIYYQYEFNGWNKELTEVVKDVTYRAIYTFTTRIYTVTLYDEDGVTVLDTIDVEACSSVDLPTNVVKDSADGHTYTFDGWYLKAADGVKYNGSISCVTFDMSLYARFIDTIEEVVDTQSDDQDTTTDDANQTTDDANQTTDDANQTTDDTDTNTTTDDSEEVTQKTCTVTWVDEDNNILKTVEINSGDTVELFTPTKETTAQYTYTFEGWYIGSELVEEAGTITEDTTYTAKFTATLRQYIVTWVINGIYIQKTQYYGEEISVPSDDSVQISGYTFLGWYVGDTKLEDYGTLRENVTVEAKYEALPQYTYKFMVNGEVYKSVTVPEGYTIVAPSDPSSYIDGGYRYTFYGWYLDNVLVTSFGEITCDVTYIAEFTEAPIQFMVTFADGYNTISTQNVYYNSYITKPDDLSKDHYTFNGWTYNDTLWNFRFDRMPAENITLYASWTEDQVEVVYNQINIDGSVTTVTRYINYSFGFDTIELEMESGYTFTGWYDASGNRWNNLTEFTSTSTLTVYREIYPIGLSISTYDGTCYVTDYSGSLTTVMIPKTYYGNKITAIGNGAFENNSTIQYVYLTSNITEIGEYAFCRCTSLINVYNTSNINTLGEYCFAKSNNLDKFSGGNIEIIPYGAFLGCSYLTAFDFETVTEVESYAFKSSGLTNLYNLDTLEIIGEGAFIETKMSSFKAGSSLKVIDDYAFNDCPNLHSFVLSSSVRYVGADIVDGCVIGYTTLNDNQYIGTSSNPYFLLYKSNSTATKGSISSDCYIIGGFAFEDNASLKTIAIPDNVMSIGKMAFANCDNLYKVTFSEDSNLRNIGQCAFASTAITSITLPYNIEVLAFGAFTYTNLKSFTVLNQTNVYYRYDSTHTMDWNTISGYINVNDYTYTGITDTTVLLDMAKTGAYYIVWTYKLYNF